MRYGLRQLLGIVAICAYTHAHADPLDNTRANWRIQTGTYLQYEQAREETLHELRNHGPGFGLVAQLQRNGASNTHTLRFDLPIGVTFDRYAIPAISLRYGLVGEGYWRINHKLALGYFGGMTVRNRLFPEWDDSHLYWMSDWSVGPAWSFTLPRYTRYESFGHLAMLSFISRSPQKRTNKLDSVVTLKGFFRTPQTGLALQTLLDVQIATLGIRRRPAANQHWLWEYRLEFARTSETLNYVEVRHQLGGQYVF